MLDIRGIADMRPDVASEQGRRIRREDEDRSRTCWPTRASTSSSTSPSRAPMSRSACARSRPASTSMAKSRSGVTFAEGKKLVAAAKQARRARRLGARHLPRRQPPAGARRHRQRQARHASSVARRSLPARAMNTGIPIRPSTTTSAAARCSTWAPITSPTSSTCSARSAGAGDERAPRTSSGRSARSPRRAR